MDSNDEVSDVSRLDDSESTKSFPFENEAIVVKGNGDYNKLLEHLNLLQSLRAQSLADIERLSELHDEYMNDPIYFLSKVENGEDLGIPDRLPLPELPEIDWGKYNASQFLDDIRPITRGKQIIRSERPEPESNEDRVRGRIKRGERPKTFNQLWTVEEQMKLEQLLIKYPPEENEARRFAKIAAELGSRTLAQVTSRCQKYFLKLQKAGLPVPGRAPRLSSQGSRSSKSKFNPHIHHLSTFFPRTQPTIRVVDGRDLPGTSSVDTTHIKTEPEDCQDYQIEVPNRDSTESRKNILLRRVQKELKKRPDQTGTLHYGFMCVLCKEEPIHGTRWHCIHCEKEASVDFCSSCFLSQLDGDNPHPLHHDFETFQQSVVDRSWDRDYSYSSTQYNYLDPNFRPD